MSIETILVGTSLDEQSDPVVRAGVRLAKHTGARLYVVHAHALPVAYFAAPSGFTSVSPDLLEAESQARQRMLDSQLERLGIDPDGLAGTIARAGAPHRLLLETAAEVGADLIVIGARETAGRVLHGSTTDRVLRKAACPVWVVAGESELPPKRVLAPVDLSPLSAESLLKAMAMLGELGGSAEELGTLFVLEDEERESSTQFTPEQIDRLAHEELDRFVDRLPTQNGHTIRRTVRIGDIRKQIHNEIEVSAADLLVLGTHGRSGFERFLLGSVAVDMAGQANCHVLVVPPAAAIDEASPEEGAQ